jgi:hypothetical protein
MNLDGVTMRVHLGDEDQEHDPFITAKMGAANTPAYRGTAYVVFEELPLERFGNRMPQLSFRCSGRSSTARLPRAWSGPSR